MALPSSTGPASDSGFPAVGGELIGLEEAESLVGGMVQWVGPAPDGETEQITSEDESETAETIYDSAPKLELEFGAVARAMISPSPSDLAGTSDFSRRWVIFSWQLPENDDYGAKSPAKAKRNTIQRPRLFEVWVHGVIAAICRWFDYLCLFGHRAPSNGPDIDSFRSPLDKLTRAIRDFLRRRQIRLAGEFADFLSAGRFVPVQGVSRGLVVLSLGCGGYPSPSISKPRRSAAFSPLHSPLRFGGLRNFGRNTNRFPNPSPTLIP